MHRLTLEKYCGVLSLYFRNSWPEKMRCTECSWLPRAHPGLTEVKCFAGLEWPQVKNKYTCTQSIWSRDIRLGWLKRKQRSVFVWKHFHSISLWQTCHYLHTSHGSDYSKLSWLIWLIGRMEGKVWLQRSQLSLCCSCFHVFCFLLFF